MLMKTESRARAEADKPFPWENVVSNKTEGNDAVIRAGRAELSEEAATEYRQALAKYGAALLAVPHEMMKPDPSGTCSEETLAYWRVIAEIHANKSMVHLKLDQGDAALKCADASVASSPGWAKAHARRGDALSALGRAVEAHNAYDKAAQLDDAAFRKLEKRARRVASLLRAAASAPVAPSSLQSSVAAAESAEAKEAAAGVGTWAVDPEPLVAAEAAPAVAAAASESSKAAEASEAAVEVTQGAEGAGAAATEAFPLELREPLLGHPRLSSEQSASLAALYRSGRVLPRGQHVTPASASQHARLLERMALDGAIAAVAARDCSMAHCACPGSRLWMVRKASELELDVEGLLMSGDAEVSAARVYREDEGASSACEVRFKVCPAKMELRFELISRASKDGEVRDGEVRMHAVYLCGLESWVRLGQSGLGIWAPGGSRRRALFSAGAGRGGHRRHPSDGPCGVERRRQPGCRRRAPPLVHRGLCRQREHAGEAGEAGRLGHQ